MKHVKGLILLLVFGSASFAFAGRVQEIYQPTIHVDARANVSQLDVEKAIKKALVGRGWKVQDTLPGVIKAKWFIRKHTAEIKIVFSKSDIRFEYVDSTNLRYKEKKGVKMIHRNFNNWIHNLERDINVGLMDFLQ